MRRWCEKHDEPLVWESGGPDKPTIHGRWYCPPCQREFVAELDKGRE